MRNMYLYSPQTVFHKLLTHKKYNYAVKQMNYCQQKTSILPRDDGNGQSLMRHHENRTSERIIVSRDSSLIVKETQKAHIVTRLPLYFTIARVKHTHKRHCQT